MIPSWMARAPADRDRCYHYHCSMVMLAVLAVSTTDEREECIYRRRLDWNVHRETLLLEGQFRRYYRMDACSFERLLSFIGPALVRDELQSRRRTGTAPLLPENMLQMTVSWLAGSNYHTTRCLGGTAVPTIYAVMHEVMNAMCECPELRIHAPTESQERVFDLADGFADISKDTILTGCVGCIDGWLCEIRAPISTEVPEVTAFYSGHYQKYGLNVQAICDSRSRFTGYYVDSPGKVGVQ